MLSRIAAKLWSNSTFDFQRAVHSSQAIACEALQISASTGIPPFRRTLGIPDQRTALFRSRFRYAENSLLCPSGAKAAISWGNCTICEEKSQIALTLRLFGGPSRERTILH